MPRKKPKKKKPHCGRVCLSLPRVRPPRWPPGPTVNYPNPTPTVTPPNRKPYRKCRRAIKGKKKANQQLSNPTQLSKSKKPCKGKKRKPGNAKGGMLRREQKAENRPNGTEAEPKPKMSKKMYRANTENEKKKTDRKASSEPDEGQWGEV